MRRCRPESRRIAPKIRYVQPSLAEPHRTALRPSQPVLKHSEILPPCRRAKSCATSSSRIISGDGKALWKTERATGRWLLFVSRLCIHDSVQGFALAAAGRSLCFLKNAMIGLPQREQHEYVAH